MDRGSIDFERLFVFTLCSAVFLVRTRENVLLQRRYSYSVDQTAGVRSDHTVILTAIDSLRAYPDPLRRVSYVDIETKKRLKSLTNNLAPPASTLPRSRSAVGGWSDFSNGFARSSADCASVVSR